MPRNKTRTHRARSPQHVPGRRAGGPTVREAVREYLADREAEGQDTRIAALQLEAHVLPRWGKRRVASLEAAELKAWRNALAATPPRRRRPKGEASPRHASVDLSDPEVRRRRRSTVNRITTIFKAALNYAASLYTDACPDRSAWREGLKAFRNADQARERWLTQDEALRLLAACPPAFRRLVRAALYTGCRYGELSRAAVRDYRSDAGVLHIPVSKSGRSRDVVLNADATAFFAELTAGRSADEPLLVREDGMPWGPWHQGRPMTKACRTAAIDPPISFHGLRHTHASLAVQSGMALVALARNLGHADTRMVERHYGHLSNRYMREQVGRHAPVFGREGGQKRSRKRSRGLRS